MYDHTMATGYHLPSLRRTTVTLRTIRHNAPAVRRPTHPIGLHAYRLGSSHDLRLRRSRDRFEQRASRFLGWDVPSLIGLAGSLGSPGFGLLSSTATSRCWAIAIGGSGISHLANAARCRRRRSLWSGPVFVVFAALGLVYGTTATSAASWDNLWTGVFLVWLFWFVFDQRRPHLRYGRKPAQPLSSKPR